MVVVRNDYPLEAQDWVAVVEEAASAVAEVVSEDHLSAAAQEASSDESLLLPNESIRQVVGHCHQT